MAAKYTDLAALPIINVGYSPRLPKHTEATVICKAGSNASSLITKAEQRFALINRRRTDLVEDNAANGCGNGMSYCCPTV